MNSKKCFILAVTLLTFLIGLNTTLYGQEQKDPNDKIKALKEKIAVGKSVSDPNYNDKLKALIKQLESVYDPNYIVYHGKKRSRLWFDKMYEAFSQKIIYVEGKYYDKKLLDDTAAYLRDKESYTKGSFVKIPSTCKVIEIIKPGEALILKEGFNAKIYGGSSNGGDAAWRSMAESFASTPEILFHVSGYNGQLVDGQSFSFEGYLISLGTYEYITVLGSKSTIPSFKACNFEPLTKEQFAKLLNSGIDIGEYELVIKEYGILGAFSENQYKFLENKDDGSVIIKKGDRIIRRLGKGKYRFEIIQKPVPTKGR